MGEAIAQWVTSTMEAWGYLGIIFLMFAENVFPPIPSELIMPFAGFTAHQGDKLSLFGVIVAGIIGSILGALPLYFVGLLVGADRLRDWTRRIGKYFLIKVEDVDASVRWFHKYGSQTVFWGRMLPQIRSVISAPAGVVHMPFGKFIAYSTAGMSLWTALLAVGGYALGANYERVETMVGYLGKGVVLLVVLGVATFVIVRLKSSKTPAASEAPPTLTEPAAAFNDTAPAPANSAAPEVVSVPSAIVEAAPADPNTPSA
jgi:membrane protein DedA with SNARE-associated domain